MDFLRHCPQCGRRFHIILVDKKLAQVLDKETVHSPPRMVKMAPLAPVWPVGEGEPVTIDTEQFQWTYKCKHCGHEWSEARTEEHVEKPFYAGLESFMKSSPVVLMAWEGYECIDSVRTIVGATNPAYWALEAPTPRNSAAG